MSGLCKVGPKQNPRCEFKRNCGDGIYACGTDAPCKDRETIEQHNARVSATLSKVSV